MRLAVLLLKCVLCSICRVLNDIVITVAECKSIASAAGRFYMNLSPGRYYEHITARVASESNWLSNFLVRKNIAALCCSC